LLAESYVLSIDPGARVLTGRPWLTPWSQSVSTAASFTVEVTGNEAVYQAADRPLLHWAGSHWGPMDPEFHRPVWRRRGLAAAGAPRYLEQRLCLVHGSMVLV